MWTRLFSLVYIWIALVDRIPMASTMTPEGKLRQALNFNGREFSEDILSSVAIRAEVDVGRLHLRDSVGKRGADDVPDIAVTRQELHVAVSPLLRRVTASVPPPRPRSVLGPVVECAAQLVLYKTHMKARYKAILDDAQQIAQLADLLIPIWEDGNQVDLDNGSMTGRMSAHGSVHGFGSASALGVPPPGFGPSAPAPFFGPWAGPPAAPAPAMPAPAAAPPAAPDPPPDRPAGPHDLGGQEEILEANGDDDELVAFWNGWLDGTWILGLLSSPLTVLSTWAMFAGALSLKWYTTAVCVGMAAVTLLVRALRRLTNAAVTVSATALAAGTALAADYAWWSVATVLTIAALTTLVTLLRTGAGKAVLKCMVHADGQPDRPERQVAPREAAPDADDDWAPISGDVWQRHVNAAPYGWQQPGGNYNLGGALANFAQGPGAQGQTGPYSPTFAQQTGWPQAVGVQQSYPQYFGMANQAPAPPSGFGLPAPGLGPPGNFNHPTGGQMQPAPQGSSTPTIDAANATGFTAEELQRLCENNKWHGMSSSMKRAAPEIYMKCRQGNSCVKDWLASTWGSQPRTQQFTDLWHAATTVDLKLDEYARAGPNHLAWGLVHDDIVEGHLRQLAAAKYYKLTGDSEASNRMLGYSNPEGSVAPTWMEDDARGFSLAKHKETMRNRKGGHGNDQDHGLEKKGKGKGKKGKNS